jgi:hypothetical protein
MIITELYDGQGFGNQLWTYTVARVVAYRKGYDFCVIGRENYKGKDIIDLDYGKSISEIPNNINYVEENMIKNPSGVYLTKFDEKVWNAPDNTKLDGGMQSMKYIENYKKEITEWLKIKENKVHTFFSRDNACVIHIRGGDYWGAGKTMLQPQYYINAMNYMLSIDESMEFFIVTDDIRIIQNYRFGKNVYYVGSCIKNEADKYRAAHHIGGDISLDYAILNSAKNIILSNSTFGFWAAWTNTIMKNIIAPKYWFAHNYNSFWSTADMEVKRWKYLDTEGNVYEA